MPQANSIDKIVGGYLGSLCRQSFTFNEQYFSPMPVVVSPLLLRGFTCPESCGGCCGKFTLDWLPHEYPSAKSVIRTINVNGADFRVFTDSQRDNSCRQCRHLHRQSGRCKIYAHRPFTCDFELIRVLRYPEKIVLTQKLYGRGWASMVPRVKCSPQMLPALLKWNGNCSASTNGPSTSGLPLALLP